uniref:Si:ch211-14i3.2 n=1 Tax=Myripristis murdjan TaxID=586833 RepID=A0A667Y1D1_9TELE
MLYPTMDHFSFLVIVLTLSQSSLGSIIPTSQSVGNSDAVEGSGNTDAQMTTGFASLTEIDPSIAEDSGRNLQKPSSIPQKLQVPLFLSFLGKDKDTPELPFQYNVFNSIINQDLSGPGAPCVFGLSPCVVLANPNGTNLLWDDMRRTLAFAWELHVFGSASLFALLAGVAVLGVAGAHTLLHPLCDALTLANSLLLLTGILRAVLLLLDPYGTRQILSRPALAALHNIPLQLLLWAQIVLALVTLRGVKLVLLPVKLQRPWTIGGMALLHCAPLLVADLLSPTLSPALPLLLQTLSLCWGLLFCIGTLTQSLSHLSSFLQSPIPQWGAPQRIENRARRVTAVCALFGILCCSLQMYSLLWLYGVLGNWRRFGWGWWLSQFWARILELAWGFTFRSKVLTNIQKGPLRKSEKNWEELMPNNWAMCNVSRTGMSNNVMCTCDDQAVDHMPDPVSSSSCDSQAALLWQRVGERECILSLVEFDMRPPSPINLRHSIDNALHHGNFVGGSLFAPRPPSWTDTVSTDITNNIAAKDSEAPVGYQWTLDIEATPGSPHHFETKESVQSPNTSTDHIANQSPNTELNFENKPQEDWSDDITNL